MKSSRPARKASSPSPSRSPAVPNLNHLPVFLSTLTSLQQALSSFQSSHGFPAPFLSPLQIYSQWLAADCEAYEKSIAGEPLVPIAVSDCETEQEVLQSFDVYSGLGLVWRIRFSPKAVARFAESSEDRKTSLMERILVFAQGQFDIGRKTTVVQCGPMRHLIALSNQAGKCGFLLLALELNKLPVVSRGTLTRFEFHHFLRVVDVLPSASGVQSSLKQYLNLLRADPAKRIHPEEKNTDSKLVSLENAVEVLPGGGLGPMQVCAESVRRGEQYCFHEGLGRWVNSAERVKNCWENIQVTLANANLISELADSASCKGLIEFLQRNSKCFPFQLKKKTTEEGEVQRNELSKEELDVIGTPGNVLAIGRSGTGKTTCSVLRILASQGLFRLRIRQQDRATSGFFGLHSVFITASATLTLEVKRFYDNIVAKLANKKVTETEPKSTEDEAEMNEKDLKIKSSTLLMTHSDFPLFSTTRLLVFAIDAGLRNPFFQVTEEGEGTAVQAGFHNELKGVKVISHMVRKEELDDNFDFQAEDAPFQAVATPLTLDPDSRDIFAKQTSFEVDFDYFERHFWPTVRGRSALSSALVWAEIAGKLKGSAGSSAYSTGHLPKEEYMTQHKKTSLLSEAEREAVWNVFMQYERWKHQKGAYDFQDVVTHALKEISLSGYDGAPIHFLMVDEVQDLTHATLLLLAKVTEQQLFFSGDTAQTIAKGVSFRFKDLSALFSTQDGLGIAPPTIKQLLVNYRSHRAVLNLANCVVRVIELMFPKTIDKLERELSDKEGDTPIVLMNPCLEEIVNALVVGESASKGNIVFGSGQVVLVPDEIARNRLPEILKGALCLTIYEAKGLEFDDVILFEFFENCGVTEDEWRLLREVLYEDRYSAPADIYSPSWKPRFLATFESAKHASLCTALKMLYVAITRTKRKFIIYDSSPSGKYLLDYLLSVGIVTQKIPKETGLNTDIPGVIQTEAGKVLWRNLGIKLMKLKFYSQAAKCFTYADDQHLRKKAESLHVADESARLLQAADAILADKRSDAEMKVAAEADKSRAIAQFIDVASSFLELGLTRYAAQCYFSGTQFKRAASLYKELHAFNEVGQCLFAAQLFKDSGRSFLKAGNLMGALRAYDRGKCWVECMKVLREIKGGLTIGKRVALIRKYSRATIEEMIGSGEEESGGTGADAAEFVPDGMRLTQGEKDWLLSCYSTEGQVVQVTGGLIDGWAGLVAASSQPDCGYGYSYLEKQGLRPSGQVVKFREGHNRDEVATMLLNIARLFEQDAVRLEAKSGESRTLTDSFDLLPADLHPAHAVRIFEAFCLKRLSFLLACSFSLQPCIKSAIESQCISVSPVHLLSQQQPSLWLKLAQYCALIAGAVTHQCLELIRPMDLRKISESEDSLYMGLIVLGYWKKVVALSTSHSSAVAAVFGDLLNVKLNYIRQRTIPDIRARQLFSNPETWPDKTDDPLDLASLLAVFEETMRNANRVIPITMLCDSTTDTFTFHRRFPRNQALWTFLLTPRDGAVIHDLNEAILAVRSDMQRASKKEISCLETVDVFSFYVETVFAMRNSDMKELMATQNFAIFEKVMLAFEFWVSLLDVKSAKGFMRGYQMALKASFMPVGVSLLSGDEFLVGFPVYSHALIHTNSILFPELLRKSPDLFSVDIEGLIFLAPISTLISILQLSAVRILTDIVLLRKEMYVQNRFSPYFPFKESSELCNERLRAKTAACIYGELAYLKRIQAYFPEEYRFVGALGEKLKEKNTRKIASLWIQISELSGEEYAADDPSFACFLRKKNAKEIRLLEIEKSKLLQRGSDLSAEEQQENELEDFTHTLPLDIYHELTWMFDPRIQLTSLAHTHLRTYLIEEMTDFDPKTDISKLRMLDNIARLCGCQKLLSALAGDQLSPLLFPEREYSVGRLLEVVTKTKQLVTFPQGSDSKTVNLRTGVDIKDKFQIVLKCILWSLVLTHREFLVPKLLALQLTRYYGSKQKVLQKRFITVNTFVLVDCLELLARLIAVVKKSDPCVTIAHTVLLILVTVLGNLTRDLDNSQLAKAVKEVVISARKAKLGRFDTLLGRLVCLNDEEQNQIAELLKNTQSIEGSLEEIIIRRKEAKRREIYEKQRNTEESHPILTEALHPNWHIHLKSFPADLEWVLTNDGLTDEESSQLQEDFAVYEARMAQYKPADFSTAVDWRTEEPIRQWEDLMLLAEFNEKIRYFDVYVEFWAHFQEEFAAIHSLGKALLNQMDIYHHKDTSAKQRQMVYYSIILLAKSTLKLKHALFLAILKCRRDHSSGDACEPTLEESRVKHTREDSERVVWKVSHLDFSAVGAEVEEGSEWLAGTEEVGTRWKLTRKDKGAGK